MKTSEAVLCDPRVVPFDLELRRFSTGVGAGMTRVGSLSDAFASMFTEGRSSASERNASVPGKSSDKGFFRIATAAFIR